MHLRNLTVATLVALAALVTALPAAAQQSNILTIDLGRAQDDTELGQDIQRQVDELQEQFRANLQSGGQQLQSQVDELRNQHEQFIITDEVYEQRLTELQQQDQQLRQRYEVSTQAMQFARSRALEAFFQAILPDVEDVMDERGGAALMEMRSLVASSEEIDITDEVIQRVNSRITSLEVELLPQRQEGEGGGE